MNDGQGHSGLGSRGTGNVTVMNAQLVGGPFDGRVVPYPSPLPSVIVMTEVIEVGGLAMPRIKYHDYQASDDVPQMAGMADVYEYRWKAI